MKKYSVLFVVFIISSKSFSQKYKIEKDTLSYKQFTTFNQLNNNSFINKVNLEKKLIIQPYHKKIDLSNPNFGKVNYDISNPNKSNDLPSFFLYGITNLFASLFN